MPDRRTVKCKKCDHIEWEDEIPSHECPSPEYIKARDKLISTAAESEEMFSLDDLEAFKASRQ